MINPRLTDLQSVLLSAALRHETGSVIPVPASLVDKGAAVRKALGQLVKRGMVAETEQPPAGTEWRSEGGLRFGLALTEHGRAAIGMIIIEDAAGTVARPFACARLARLSWLAPDIVSAILEGKQPRSLTARQLLRAPRCRLPGLISGEYSGSPEGSHPRHRFASSGHKRRGRRIAPVLVPSGPPNESPSTAGIINDYKPRRLRDNTRKSSH